ncbi:hypothetical protein ES703_02906 [subsurface metagenome]
MRIFLYNPFFLGGEVDLYKFKTHIQEKYPGTQLLSVNWVHRLSIPFISGEIVKIKDTTCTIPFESEITLFEDGIAIGEFRYEVKGKRFEMLSEPSTFFSVKFKYNDREDKRQGSLFSLNFEDMDKENKREGTLLSFLVSFLWDALGIEGIEEKDKRGEGFVNELKEELGLDAFIIGESGLHSNLGNKIFVLCLSSDISQFRHYKLRKVSLANFEVYLIGKDSYLTPKLYEGLKEDLLMFFHYRVFLNRFRLLGMGWQRDIEGDLTDLRLRSKEGHESLWQEKREILETKSLNFMRLSSFVSQRLADFENAEFRTCDSEKLMQYSNTKKYTKQLLGILNEVKYMLDNLNRMIDVRDSLSLRYGSRRVEEGLKILGILGGLAVILVALLSQGLNPFTKFGVIGTIVAIPALYFVFQSMYTISKKRKSRKHFLESKIKVLRKSIEMAEKEKEELTHDESIEGVRMKEELELIYGEQIRRLQDEINRNEEQLKGIKSLSELFNRLKR